MVSKIIEEPSYRDRRFVFVDRLHAGELLAAKIQRYVGRDPILLAVPAGGVPVGYAVAKRLMVQLEVIVVRKIQFPWNPEAGFGAVAWDGTTIINELLVTSLGLSGELVQRCVSLARKNVYERVKKFRGDKPFPSLKGRVVTLIDDGLASGFTMLAAVESVRKQSPKEIVVAVPTSSESAVDILLPNVDKLVCLNVRGGPVFAVADAYQSWYDVSDEEVMKFLKMSQRSEQT
ncbi:MAG: phosphoribosyltransferase family protein [Candidatus Bathyarchaeia archaeon]